MSLLIATSSITILSVSPDCEPHSMDFSNLPTPAPYYGEIPSGAIDWVLCSSYLSSNNEMFNGHSIVTL